MGSHHDHNDHHSNEKKPVAFTVPLIFASVIVFIIVLFVSIGDPNKGECCCNEEKCSKECMEKCEAGGHEKECCKEDAKAAHMGGHDDHATEVKDSEATTAADSTAKTEHKEEAHH